MNECQPILVVDDDRAIRDFVTQFLEDEGYPVLTASDGLRALAAVEQRRPALVLLDMRMPVLDGWGFVRHLRQHGLDVPIIVMTAAYGADGERWAREVGAIGMLAKPFDLMDLLALVEAHYHGTPAPVQQYA